MGSRERRQQRSYDIERLIEANRRGKRTLGVERLWVNREQGEGVKGAKDEKRQSEREISRGEDKHQARKEPM